MTPNKVKLQAFEAIFEAYRDLDISDFDFEVDALRFFHDEHSNYFTEEEHDLYETIEGLADSAATHFQAIATEEMLEEEREQRSYEGAKHLS